MTVVEFLVITVGANVVAYVLERVRVKRAKRPNTLLYLVDAARLCERDGWIPLKFRWRGLLRTEAALLMRNRNTGEYFTVRAIP